ncbi:MAG: pantoate--beta-alanine ligase [Gammaproteobacteria bacterium]|nr:pantoate--beta-alanine ligase [Gammaproteobacteria bacterium]
METVFDLAGLHRVISKWKSEGASIAFVPTMGNLHAGHYSLLERARELADKTVVSIFVNPIQFGKGEDYESYPSTLEADSNGLADNDLDLLFAPDLNQLYPGGVATDTRVEVPGLSDILCGRFRPGHFSGVATVVAKLLINVQPDIALFGEKDYQQLLVIRRVVTDLCMPVEVIGMPIVREADGLAMSSRNAYLNLKERNKAPLIYATLQRAAQRLRESPHQIPAIEAEGMKALESSGFKPEYFSVRRSENLAEPNALDKKLSILTAAWLGSARLIDNVKVLVDSQSESQ